MTTDLGIPEPSPERMADAEWARAFIRGAVARTHEHFHAEPPTEPARASWHWERNKRLMSECGGARAAYAAKFGREMPEDTSRLLEGLEWMHHTNPYLDGSVYEVAFKR